jgi:hypothetical protein
MSVCRNQDPIELVIAIQSRYNTDIKNVVWAVHNALGIPSPGVYVLRDVRPEPWFAIEVMSRYAPRFLMVHTPYSKRESFNGLFMPKDALVFKGRVEATTSLTDFHMKDQTLRLAGAQFVEQPQNIECWIDNAGIDAKNSLPRGTYLCKYAEASINRIPRWCCIILEPIKPPNTYNIIGYALIDSGITYDPEDVLITENRNDQ